MNKSKSRAAKKITESIHQEQAAFLVGAGISMLYPCSLPSGMELKDMSVRLLLRHPSLNPYSDKLDSNEKYQHIVPEILFQRMFESLRESFLPFFDLLRFAQPNIAHATLASLSREFGVSVFTTNFDLLIEECKANADNILHLHGRIDEPENMMIRINQVGRGPKGTLRDSFLRLTKGKDIYVLGYSGNDLDILELINASDVRSITWFTLDGTDAWLLGNLKKIKPKHSLRIVQGDLRDLFAELSSLFSTTIQQETRAAIVKKNFVTERLDLVSGLSERMPLSQKFACLGKIFFELEEYQIAADIYEEGGLKNFASTIHHKFWFYSEAANCYRIIGNFDKGFQLTRNVIEHEDEITFYSLLTQCYNVRGLMFLEQEVPAPKEAVACFEKALTHLERFQESPDGDRWREGIAVFFGRIYNNLGLSHDQLGDFDEAERCYKTSLHFKKKTGDLVGISQTSANIALVFYKDGAKGRFRYWRKRFFALAEKYSLSYQKGMFLRRLGEIQSVLDSSRRGIENLKEARDIFRQIPNASFDLKLTEEDIQKYENVNHPKDFKGESRR